MMIKVFTLNENNKIELTKQELEKLLNESFWEGYNKKNDYFWTYTSPCVSPFKITTTDLKTSGTITANLSTEA